MHIVSVWIAQGLNGGQPVIQKGLPPQQLDSVRQSIPIGETNMGKRAWLTELLNNEILPAISQLSDDDEDKAEAREKG